MLLNLQNHAQFIKHGKIIALYSLLEIKMITKTIIIPISALFLLSSTYFTLLKADIKSEATNNSLNQKKIILLGIKFQNDHESQEPTSEAENNRIKSLAEIFKTELELSGKYNFIPINQNLQSKIKNGTTIGECGGCEFDYGKEAGADISAWILVQKVSNLILNINLYVVDVRDRKILLTQSVDIRGNTDDSWKRGMKYLIKNHVLR